MGAFDLVRTNRARAIIAETVLPLFLFFADPLGVVAYKARAIDDSVTVLTQFAHKSQAAGKLAVLLIDQGTLDTWRIDWPLTYGRMSGLIHSLACANVAGVFFDFTLSEKFNLSEGKDQLQAATENSSKVAGDWPNCDNGKPPARIAVYFGKAESIDSPLAQALDDYAFSIDVRDGDGVYPAGGAEFPDKPVPIGQAAPAFGIIRNLPQLLPGHEDDPATPCDFHDPRPKCWVKPLALEWTADVDPHQGAVADMDCRGFPGWHKIVAGLFGITQEGRYEPCPPILTLKAEDLYRDRNYIAEYGNPADLLQGRFVFVGTELAGLNDQIFSPVHGYLPGVYKHAVATDNLLSYGADYPTVPRPWLLGVMVVLTYFLIGAVRELSQDVRWRRPALVLTAVVALSAWFAIIYYLKWPWSLMVTIFGYYSGGVLFVEAARYRSPESKPPALAQPEPQS
jgi:hypothetical protein